MIVLASQAAWAAGGLKVIDPTPDIFKPHSGPADMLMSNAMFVFVITGAIFVVVGGTWLYSIYRF